MTQNNNIFISSGGTGGHIIPARCLALELVREGYKVQFLGDIKYQNYVYDGDDFESSIISSSQIEKKPLKLIKASFKIAFGILQSLYKIISHRPKYVVAFGGYATFPVLIAAILTRTKIILHEQNAHLGKVNRIFAKYAFKIALTFEETSGINQQDLKKTVVVGNPVREEILKLGENPYLLPKKQKKGIQPEKEDNKMGYEILLASDFKKKPPEEEENELFNILIIGGSGGAKIFSEILPKAFFNLSEDLKNDIKIVQQCRSELMHQTFDQYKSFNLSGEIQSFFNDMPQKIKEAHLVIARSGSSSVFEFCAAKKPMILIPFAKAADDHQKKNAHLFEKNGAAIVIEEKDFTIRKIGEVLRQLIGKPEILKKMSNSAASLAKADATKNLVSLIKNDTI